MNTYVFCDLANNMEMFRVEAESHPEAIEIAYELMGEPEFQYIEE